MVVYSVWGFQKANEFDLIQNRAMRYYLGVHKYAPIAGMRGDMGWCSLLLGRKMCSLRLWNKLILMDDSRITKHVFNYDYQICKNNWNSKIKKLLTDINMQEYFENKMTINLTYVRNVLLEKEIANWKQQTQSKAKLRTYRGFKTEWQPEPYVMYCKQRGLRALLAQFRLGILPLKIEIGRFDNTPLNERTCFNCVETVEDENHFILDCPLYNKEREVLLQKAVTNNLHFREMRSEDKFNYLVDKMWKDTSFFLSNAWQQRQNALYNDK